MPLGEGNKSTRHSSSSNRRSADGALEQQVKGRVAAAPTLLSRALAGFSLQFWVSVDRQSRNIVPLAVMNALMFVFLGLLFGLLFLNSTVGYVLASVIYAFACFMPVNVSSNLSGKHHADGKVFQRDQEINAMSTVAFCLGTWLQYVVMMVPPVCAALAVTVKLVLASQFTTSRFLALAVLILADCTNAVTVSLFIGGLCYRIDSDDKLHNYIAVAWFAFNALTSGFFISAEDVSPVLGWGYVISWTQYTYISSMRVLLTGVQSPCPSNELFNTLLCQTSSPDGFLSLRGLSNVDVGNALFYQLAFTGVYFALYVVLMLGKSDLGQLLQSAAGIAHQVWRKACATLQSALEQGSHCFRRVRRRQSPAPSPSGPSASFGSVAPLAPEHGGGDVVVSADHVEVHVQEGHSMSAASEHHDRQAFRPVGGQSASRSSSHGYLAIASFRKPTWRLTASEKWRMAYRAVCSRQAASGRASGSTRSTGSFAINFSDTVMLGRGRLLASGEQPSVIAPPAAPAQVPAPLSRALSEISVSSWCSDVSAACFEPGILESDV